MPSRERESCVLAEPEEVRARWEYSPPTGFRDERDSVSFRATPISGSSNKAVLAEHNACYACIRLDYNQYEVVCSPAHEVRLSEKMFYDSFGVFVEQGLISELIEARIEKGVPQIYSPGKGLTNQEIYVALCWYRWTDSHPGLIARFLSLWNNKQYPWNVFQILTYTVARHIANYGHSFISARGYGGAHPWMNPLLGVAAKSYFADGTKHRDKNEYVNSTIAKVCSSFTETISIPAKGEETWRGRVDVPTFCVKDVEDVLSPRFIELYEIEHPTKGELQGALEGIFARGETR